MNLAKVRITISLLCAASLLLALIFRSSVLSGVLILLCLLSALGLLYTKLPQLSNVAEDSPRLKTLRAVTLLNLLLITGLAALCLLTQGGVITLTENAETLLIPLLFAFIMVVFGNMAPKIPHNRYTGLRLPWTVSDEETWIVAHRALGYLSLPCGFLCLIAATIPATAVQTSVAVLLGWIIIPSVLSLIYYLRKYAHFFCQKK